MFPGNICVCVSGFFSGCLIHASITQVSDDSPGQGDTFFFFAAVLVFIFFKACIILFAGICKLFFLGPQCC